MCPPDHFSSSLENHLVQAVEGEMVDFQELGHGKGPHGRNASDTPADDFGILPDILGNLLEVFPGGILFDCVVPLTYSIFYSSRPPERSPAPG